jgi:dTDP-4-amino-4,6-dideoxygalactose transaminase
MVGPGYSFLGEQERKNVEQVLSTWQLTRYAHDKPDSTSFVSRFEAAAQQYFGTSHAVAVNTGTSALLTALGACGIGPGDEVIVPAYTFIASIGTIVYSGATPVLAEVDESFTLDPVDVARRITPRTRAIMPVHMLGASCDMAALRELAERHHLMVIEDVAQACGASYQGQPLGTHGDIGAFSLNQFKVITSGEGGFVLTTDDRLHQRSYSFQDQGWYPGRTDDGEGDVMFGLNLRMPELDAAVACAQLEKLDTVLESCRRRKNEVASLIPDRDGLRRRTLHDAEGECGTLLVYVFDRAKDAAAVADKLGTRTMQNSGRHYYANMPALAALAADDPGRPCPFQNTKAAVPGAYQVGTFPQTDSVLSRSVAISVGVNDRYIGSGFGVTVRSSGSEVEQVAERFTDVVSDVVG